MSGFFLLALAALAFFVWIEGAAQDRHEEARRRARKRRRQRARGRL